MSDIVVSYFDKNFEKYDLTLKEFIDNFERPDFEIKVNEVKKENQSLSCF